MSMTTTAPSRREAQGSAVKPRVLVVEDETALVELLRYNLEQAGFVVTVAYDGDAAARTFLFIRGKKPFLRYRFERLPWPDGGRIQPDQGRPALY